MILEIKDIDVYYGIIKALKGVSLNIREGEIVAILGSNGSGKSTLFRTIMGLSHCRGGSIYFCNKAIHSSQPEEISRLGIGFVPEGRRIFSSLTVQENLELGAYLRKDREQIKQDMQNIFELFPKLKERINQLGGTLSGGEQQMLSISRALMVNPKLLLLDELSFGLSPIIVEHLFELISQIRNQGKTVLIAEQNVRMSLQSSDRGYILENGRIIHEDNASVLLESDILKNSYLGT